MVDCHGELSFVFHPQFIQLCFSFLVSRVFFHQSKLVDSKKKKVFKVLVKFIGGKLFDRLIPVD
jgi:hypothetical protein